jgi:ABC-type uncharacterized transport system involved in gliding motility auxiliary subunit
VEVVMSRIGKIFLSFSGLSFIVMMVLRLIVGGWSNYMFVFLGMFLLFFILSIVKDFVLYKELFFLRTTKHGINFGFMVILVLIGIGAVNYVAYVQNKKIDVTEEKMNSLSDQTSEILKKLDSDLEILGFFKAGSEQDDREKFQFTDLTNLFKNENNKIKVFTHDPLKRPDLAKKYNVETSGEVVISYKGKQNTTSDLTEEALTNAIIKITRSKNKIIYLLKGHGERDPASEDREGASRFKKALEDASYEVRTLSLVETKTVPQDADVVAILGGNQPLLDFEAESLKSYAGRGGRLFVGADPGSNHNLGALLKNFGVEFKNNYVLDQIGQLVGFSAAVAIGMSYSKTSEITKKFGEQMTAFQLASQLSKASDAPAEFKVEELVMSSPASFAKKEIAGQVRQQDTDAKGPLPVAMSVSGTLAGKDQKEPKEFSVVAFGDSDFVTNQMLHMQLNRDLAVNSFAFLAKDAELVSIRPKQAKGTTLQMTQNTAKAAFWGFSLLPLFMLALSVFLWNRRRGA